MDEQTKPSSQEIVNILKKGSRLLEVFKQAEAMVQAIVDQEKVQQAITVSIAEGKKAESELQASLDSIEEKVKAKLTEHEDTVVKMEALVTSAKEEHQNILSSAKTKAEELLASARSEVNSILSSKELHQKAAAEAHEAADKARSVLSALQDEVKSAKEKLFKVFN